MKKEISEHTMLLPVVFLPYQIVYPGVFSVVHVGAYTNVSGLACANCTHRRFFLPFADSLKTESEEAIGGAVEDGSFRMEMPVFGVICEIINSDVKEDRESCDMLVRGISRGKCFALDYNRELSDGLFGDVRPVEDLPEPENQKFDVGALKKIVIADAKRYAKRAEKLGRRIDTSSFSSSTDAAALAYLIADALETDYYDAKALIMTPGCGERLLFLKETIQRQMGYLDIEERILAKTGRSLSEQQKEAFLREQIRVISEELGDDDASECDKLEDRLEAVAAYMSDSTVDHIAKEINRLRRVPSASPDFSVMKMHLDFVLELPWEPKPQKRIDLEEIRRILDRDHYGLDKVKERIVEFMAVKTMKNATAGSIICLYGPPGTGKTSIVRSISEALGREYVRVSLGGVRDEAEIRGHRKTYVGAMPGRILTAVEKAKTKSPVILLDEIDKLCGDFRGDPASALLEVLDREQNRGFTDSYAEVPFDLSDVLFITTANSLETIPEPLLDRLEVIELTSYTESEKFEIARRHLIPRLAKEHGLGKNAVKITDDAIHCLINEYTQEAGVRSLERQIASIMRKSICKMQKEGKRSLTVSSAKLFDMLGAGRAIHRFRTEEGRTAVGMVNGMAWTAVGGVLLNVEVNVLEGTGKLEITGMIGDVMKESAVAALSFIRSRSEVYGVNPDFYKTKDIHIHLPEGATPKDGPSAGVTITTAILSALTGIPVKQNVAMTGEITIRGDVLAIGGLKEKSLAALKEGITEIFVPAENAADVRELPEAVLKGLKITSVTNVDEILKCVLCPECKEKNEKPTEKETGSRKESADSEAKA